MNHVWMVTIKSLAAKQRLLSIKELHVKGKTCLVLAPNKTEIRMKLHSVSYHRRNYIIHTALEPYGDIEEVSSDTWKVPGLEGVESTTRLVRLILKTASLLIAFLTSCSWKVARYSSSYLGDHHFPSGAIERVMCERIAGFHAATHAVSLDTL